MNINILVMFVLKEIVISEISQASKADGSTEAPRGTNFRKVSKGKRNGSFGQEVEIFFSAIGFFSVLHARYYSIIINLCTTKQCMNMHSELN